MKLHNYFKTNDLGHVLGKLINTYNDLNSILVSLPKDLDQKLVIDILNVALSRDMIVAAKIYGKITLYRSPFPVYVMKLRRPRYANKTGTKKDRRRSIRWGK